MALYSSKKGPTKIPLVKGTAHENKKHFNTKLRVNTCRNFLLGRLFEEELEEKEDGERGF